jgi:hypothetical protein
MLLNGSIRATRDFGLCLWEHWNVVGFTESIIALHIHALGADARLLSG